MNLFVGALVGVPGPHVRDLTVTLVPVAEVPSEPLVRMKPVLHHVFQLERFFRICAISPGGASGFSAVPGVMPTPWSGGWSSITPISTPPGQPGRLATASKHSMHSS